MEQFTAFSEEDRRLDEFASQHRRHHGAREDIIREGEHSRDNHLILSGLACRYKRLPDGGRRIVAFLACGTSVRRASGRLSAAHGEKVA